MPSDHQQDAPFKPWRKGFWIAAALGLPGAGAAYYAVSHQPLQLKVLGGGVVAMWASWIVFKGAYARWLGKQVESASVKSIKLPDGWKLESGVLVAGAGDIDLVIEGPDGNRFAVEIKSNQDVQVASGIPFLTKPKLQTKEGKSLPAAFLAQAAKNAERVDAAPVLWFPKARNTSIQEIGKVQVVLGDKTKLLKAMGCKKSGFSWW